MLTNKLFNLSLATAMTFVSGASFAQDKLLNSIENKIAKSIHQPSEVAKNTPSKTHDVICSWKEVSTEDQSRHVRTYVLRMSGSPSLDIDKSYTGKLLPNKLGRDFLPLLSANSPVQTDSNNLLQNNSRVKIKVFREPTVENLNKGNPIAVIEGSYGIKKQNSALSKPSEFYGVNIFAVLKSSETLFDKKSIFKGTAFISTKEVANEPGLLLERTKAVEMTCRNLTSFDFDNALNDIPAIKN